MSDTPRTDKAQGKTLNPRYEYTSAEYEAWEHTRQLERELNEAKKDSERLDWLLKETDILSVDGLTNRADIDNFMEAEA